MQILKDEILERILNAAKELFIAYSYEKTSMEKISQKAKISKSNLYNYFKSKDEIFNALTDNAAYQFQKSIDYFYKNQFSPKFGEKGFEEMFAEQVFELIRSYKDELILLIQCSAGTKHEQLKEKLMKQITEKFIRDYATDFYNSELLVKVVTENLFDGITSLTIHAKSEQELKTLLHSFIKYHSHGFSALISFSKGNRILS